MSDDFSADRQTSGRVEVGGSARGEIETAGDRDWFAFTLEAGKTYRFDLKGWATNDGTLLNPYLRGIHDASGALIAGTANDDGGKAINSMVDFTAAAAGVYYVSAGSRYENAGLGRIFTEGTYVLSVKHVPRPGEAGDPPSFGSAGYAFDLGENADGSATPVALGSVSATDPNGEAVRYSIVGGNAAGLFAIDAETGALTYTGAGKVHEAGTSHALTVRANDGSLHADTTVTVTVIEVAEAPAFGLQGYTFVLAENADGSATPVALGSVSATDPDGDAVRYSIVGGNSAGLFAIDAETGALSYTGAGEDHESAASRTLTVRASDGSLHGDAVVTVNIADEAEAPVFESPARAFVLARSEDGRTNPVSLGTVAASDPEEDPVRYSIVGGNASGLFVIDAKTGALSYTGAGGVFEPGTSKALTVRASDGSLHADTAVTVRVTDDAETAARDDFTAGTDTTGRVVAGGSVDGEIETAGDRDWFAVTLEAGKTYLFDLEGSMNRKGTLSGPYMHGIHDAEGALVSGETDSTGGNLYKGRAVYTAPEDGTYYVAAGAQGRLLGTYTVSVHEYSPITVEAGTLDELASFMIGGAGPRATDASSPNPVTVDLTRLAADGRQLARWALEAWEAVANLEFVEVAGVRAAITFDDSYSWSAYASIEKGGESVTGTWSRVVVPGFAIPVGGGPLIDTWAFFAYAHEIGHVLGFRHPGPYGGAGTMYDKDAIFANDSWQVTLLSYFDQVANTRTAASFAIPVTPMMADVVAIQHLYGAAGGSSATAGDTVWGRNSNLDGHLGNVSAILAGGGAAGVYGGRNVAITIYDRDGIDTLDLSTSDSDNRIDLRDARFSDVNGLVGNLGIARGTVIENVVSGSGNDDITGNDADNRIDGGAGNDTTRGGKGDDLLRMGRGADTATGGAGADAFEFHGSEIGANTVTDFERGVDTLRLDDALWTGALTAAQVIERFASLVNGNVVFDFGDGNTITLNGVATTAGFADDLEILTTTAPGTPIFDALRYAFDLAENADGSAAAVALGSVSATDPDEGDTVTYSIVGGNDGGLFAIEGSTGALSYVGSGEDHEAGSTVHELTVRASDGSLHADRTVAVNVTDVAEAPSFGAESYAFDLAENADGSATPVVLGSVSATDPDEGDTVTYSIEDGNDAGLFAISPTTGALTYIGAGEDYETGARSHALTVRASDGTLHADVAVTVNVTDVVEVPDDFTAGTDTAGAVGIADGDESVTGEIEVAGDRDWFAVTLAAGRTYRFDLKGAGTQDGLFGTLADPYLHGIHDADGNLVPGTTDDDGGWGRNSRVEFTPSADGTYYVAAGGAGAGTGTYTLRVRDVSPDAPPQAPAFGSSSYAFDLAENADGSATAVALGTVLATDPDQGDTVAYSIEDGNDARLFAIDGTTGALTYTGAGEDHESATKSHALTVRASDGTLHADVAVTVNVTDVPDVAPVFGSSSYAFDLAENADGSTTPVSLGSVSATDPEAGDTVEYSIVAGNGASLFAIDGTTGALTYIGKGEDHEAATKSHALTVRASDGTLHADVAVTVNVADVAEAPAFDAGTYAFDLAENADGSATPVALGSVSATDPDQGDTVEYSIVAGNAAGLFAIDGTTGALTYTGAGEDHESATKSHALTVRASDGTLHADVAVTVNVTDVPDVAPVFGSSSYAFDLAENADGSATPVSLGSVSATDPEAGDTVEYSIVAGNAAGLFAIDGTTGALTYTGAGEDYETDAKSHALTIRASDGTLHADVTVTVNVTDVVEVPDDYTAGTDTTGAIALAGGDVNVTGEIETAGDRDWFAVTLAAGRTYQFDLKGSGTQGGLFGTLADPYLHGIHDADGNLVAGTTDDNGGTGRNSLVTFTPAEDGTWYVAAGAAGNQLGNYTLSVEEVL